jgi:hypothetical protein
MPFSIVKINYKLSICLSFCFAKILANKGLLPKHPYIINKKQYSWKQKAPQVFLIAGVTYSPQHYSKAKRGAYFSAAPLTKIVNNEFQAKPTFSPNKLGQYHRF